MQGSPSPVDVRQSVAAEGGRGPFEQLIMAYRLDPYLLVYPDTALYRAGYLAVVFRSYTAVLYIYIDFSEPQSRHRVLGLAKMVEFI